MKLRLAFIVLALAGVIACSKHPEPATAVSVPVAAAPAPAPTPVSPAPSPGSTTNADIIKMAQVKLSDNIILAEIKKAEKPMFDVTPTGLVALKNAGVSDKVIEFMLNPSVEKDDEKPAEESKTELPPPPPAPRPVRTVAARKPIPIAVPAPSLVPVVPAPISAPVSTAVPPPPLPVVSGKPTVAVLDFDYGTVKKEWSGVTIGQAQPVMDTWDVGKGMADLLVDELINDNGVRLLERKKLGDILQEQNLAKSDRADVTASHVAQLSHILGARYFVTGSVTKFGSEDSHIGGLGGGGNFFSGFVGGLGFKKSTARVGLSVRVIDSSTGEILVGVKAEGQAKRKGMILGGLGAKGGGFGGGGFDMGSSNFQETILGEATMQAVKDAGAKLTAALEKLGR